MRKIYRPRFVFDAESGMIPVGRTKFYGDYVLRDEVDPLIPGTLVRRLRLVDLGPRSRGITSDEVERVINELAASPHIPFRIPRKEERREFSNDNRKG